ncbi:MAG: putative ABC transport system permease protein [Kangiellaceae bacterium]|jgi:putative ABC transport system permease protein
MFFHYLDLAWRSFKRTPLVSVLMVMAIGVGIGITMTSLSVYHMASMDPIEHKSDKLFNVQLNTMDDGNTWWTEDDLPQQVTYKDAMALYQAGIPGRKVPSMKTGFTVHMNSDQVKPFLESTRVTGRDFFTMFDLSFLYGDTWSLEQERSVAPVVVISEELNDKLFGGENSVGKEIYLDDDTFQIVGVTQKWNIHTKYYDINNGAFNSPENIFMPVTQIAPMELGSWGNSNGWKFEEINTFKDRLNSELFWMQFWVELDTPEQEAQYRVFLNNYLTEQASMGRFTRKEVAFGLRNVNDWLVYSGVVSEENRILVGLSFMFLIVCLANILGLLLGKFLRRAPEIGVRRALGASKRDIFIQHLVEVSALGFIGGLLGIGIAQLGLWGVRESYNYYSALATMDVYMLFAAPFIAITACIIAGLYPAWLVCRTAPALYLKTQ